MKRLLACIVCAFFLMSWSRCTPSTPEDPFADSISLVASPEYVLYDPVFGDFYDSTITALDSITITAHFLSEYAPLHLKANRRIFNFLPSDGDSCFLRISADEIFAERVNLLDLEELVVVFSILGGEHGGYIKDDTVSFRIDSDASLNASHIDSISLVAFPEYVLYDPVFGGFYDSTITALDSIKISTSFVPSFAPTHLKLNDKIFDFLPSDGTSCSLYIPVSEMSSLSMSDSTIVFSILGGEHGGYIKDDTVSFRIDSDASLNASHIDSISLVASPEYVWYDSVFGGFYDSTITALDSITISTSFVPGFAPTHLKLNGKIFDFLPSDGTSCSLYIPVSEMSSLSMSDSTIVFSILGDDGGHIKDDTISFRIDRDALSDSSFIQTCTFYPDTVRRSYDLDRFVGADGVTIIDSLEVTIAATGEHPELHWADGRVFSSWTPVSDTTWRMRLPLEDLFPNGRTTVLESKIHFETPHGRFLGEYSFPFRRLYVGGGDPLFSQSWHLDFVDTVLGHPIHPNAHINILDAWELTKGAGVTVAVIDESYDRFHEDLTAVTIFNVANGSAAADHVGEGFSHGTACAGVIGARENGVGMIGVAPESDLLLIGDTSPYPLSDASLIKAFAHAVDQGAKVISCSWGSYNTSSFLESAIEKAYKAGASIVFAAGNDSLDLNPPEYRDPSEFSTVIGVSASGEQGYRASYSNWGDSLDIMAPGGDGNPGIRVLDNRNGAYAWSNGTSFSAPVVAGVIALMLSVNSSLTPDQVRQILIETAEKVPGENVEYDANGFSAYHAYGRINAFAAVERALKGI